MAAEEAFSFTSNRAEGEIAKAHLFAGGRLAASRQTWSISGRVTSGGAGLSGVSVTAGSASVETDAEGYYLIWGVGDGMYTVKASMGGYFFAPISRQVTIQRAIVTGQDFEGQEGALSPPPCQASLEMSPVLAL